jgi:glycosyltransferase involved in cell wall biosynthesis
MKRLLLINSVCGQGSTGKICVQLAGEYEQNGYEVRIAYGRFGKPSPGTEKYAVRIGSMFDVYVHVMYSRFFDRHGLASKMPTKRFLKWADEYDPDILWLHNIHDYYVNYELLFDWIKNRQRFQKEHGQRIMEVRLTLHDCWAFTGHCTHFSFMHCDKWKTGCGECPQIREYPASVLADNSDDNYRRKRNAFSGVADLTLITPSNWLRKLVKKSFLADYPTEVRYNTVDNEVFKPISSGFRMAHEIRDDQVMLLGVSGIWSKKKGLDDFKKLSGLLNLENDDRYCLVLVGLSLEQINNMPKGILCIPKTESARELAEIYSAADAFVNLTYEDTFPTVNLEAESCGTRVITYDTGGCRETVRREDSVVVPTGDIDGVFKVIRSILR